MVVTWIRRHPYLTLGLVIAVTRIISCYVFGMHFDMRPLIYFDQTLDPVLLRDRLLESLWYCHTQPPVMNFAIGVMLKMFGPSSTAFYLLNVVLGFGGACALYALLRRMGVGLGLALGAVILLFVGPTALVTEQQVFYDYPMMVCMCVAGLLLHRYAVQGLWRDGLLFFAVLAVIALTRSLYHPVWIVAVLVVLVLGNRKRWQRTVLVSLPALAVVIGWYAKNLVLFGGFFGSSWMGANLQSPTLSKIPRAERLERIARKEFSPVSAIEDPFAPLDSFRALGYDVKPVRRGIPVLDMEVRTTGAPNYNNPNYIAIHKELESDGRKVIAENPKVFARSFAAALVIYCMPASDVWAFDVNRLKMVPYDWLYNKLVFWQINYEAGRNLWLYTADPALEPQSTSAVIYNFFHAGLVLLIMVPLLTILSGWWWWRALRKREAVDAAMYGYMFVTFGLTLVVGNLLSVAENSRYRFAIDPYYLALTGVLWNRLRAWRVRRTEHSSPIPA